MCYLKRPNRYKLIEWTKLGYYIYILFDYDGEFFTIYFNLLASEETSDIKLEHGYNFC